MAFLFTWFHCFADLSSLLRDDTVIEEEERRGSSSESSACLVGTTTHGLENTPPKGTESDLNLSGRWMLCLPSVRNYI